MTEPKPLTRSQKRRAQRNRRPAKLYFTPENLEAELYLRGIEASWRNVQKDNHRAEGQRRAIPTGGPARRRAKAAARANAAALSPEQADG